MKLTEEMLYELLLNLNERLEKDYIKEFLNNYFIFNIIMVKRISVYNNKEKMRITVSMED